MALLSALNTAAGALPVGICAADFDNDGDLDLAVTNNASFNVSILFNRSLPSNAAEREGLESKYIGLLQAYPNPFNAQTTISYTLAQAGPVTLSIYNLLGQKVATLVNGIEQAGEHKVVWEAVGVMSGAYFYRIKAGEFAGTKKMVLLK